ncbi:hypothetical protein [Paenibacillus sp. N3.4]|uniref:hypothetical protein n=1 Tax=Paenibacillus sp. N3.4 TaxID=2603222 RepID=UPI0011C80633|nr:hypothetical protein [Paenibacillus sp. N3.4]TXK70262.1 hypothetical protein FU659_33655 [Paenibacillus sp. N3.4]
MSITTLLIILLSSIDAFSIEQTSDIHCSEEATKGSNEKIVHFDGEKIVEINGNKGYFAKWIAPREGVKGGQLSWIKGNPNDLDNNNHLSWCMTLTTGVCQDSCRDSLKIQ